MLEAAIVLGGLVGGYSIGTRLRQTVHDASALTSSVSGEASGGADERRRKQQSQLASLLADDEVIVTAMLVGEPSVGKSLFVARMSNPPDGPGRQALPKTMLPGWQKVRVALPSQLQRKGRISAAAAAAPAGSANFQLLDTPGGLPGLCVPFYRGVQCVVLMFDVGQASSYEALKSKWYADVKLHRLDAPGARHASGSTVVLAHVVDERRTREVTRREAGSWCASVGLPYFETHPAEHMPKVLAHLASAIGKEQLQQGAAGGDAAQAPPVAHQIRTSGVVLGRAQTAGAM